MSAYTDARLKANFSKNTHGFYVDLNPSDLASSVIEAAAPRNYRRLRTEIEEYGFEVWGVSAIVGMVHVASYCKADGGLCIHIV